MHPWSLRRRPNAPPAPARWWPRRGRHEHRASPTRAGVADADRERAREADVADADRERAREGEELEILITRARDARRLTLSGKLTVRTAPRLADCLEEASTGGVDRIVVDLSGLRVLDPPAVGPLLAAHLRAQDDHRELMLIRGPTPVQRVLDRVEGPFRYLSGSRRDRLR